MLNSDSSDTHSEFEENSSSNKRKKSKQSQHNSKRPRIELSDSEENILFEKALSVMNTSDEYDVFGQFVASELRQMNSLSTRMMAKREIMQSLLKYGNALVSTVTQPTIQINEHQGMSYASNEKRIIEPTSTNVYQNQSDPGCGATTSNITYNIHEVIYETDQSNSNSSYQFPYASEYNSNTYTNL